MSGQDKKLREDHDYYFSPIPWRYTGLRAKAFGLDPMILLLIPLAFFGLRQEYGVLFFGTLIAVAILFFVSGFKGYPSFLVFVRSMLTRFIQRGEWKTR